MMACGDAEGNQMEPKALHAKAPDAIGSGTASRRPSEASTRKSAATLLRDIRGLLHDGQVYDARRLAAESVREYPEHAELHRAHEVLNVGSSRSGKSATGRSTRAELEWLRDPPGALRGKWVALIGRDVIGSADSLKELVANLPPDLEQTPLAVQVAAR